MTPTAADAQTTKETQMTTTTTSTLEERLAPIAAELATVQDHIKALQERESHLKTQIRELVPGTDAYEAGPLAVVVSTNNRFDPKRALDLVPDALRPVVVEMVPTVNKKKLEALAPDLYEQCLNIGDYRVSLR